MEGGKERRKAIEGAGGRTGEEEKEGEQRGRAG